ncbi:MAG TPA: GNAT family N-acetyltransferase [Patescibacteria group bacterium]|nr:GNAT family N-acetyltransferase [Patescibacteria group bacterium]
MSNESIIIEHLTIFSPEITNKLNILLTQLDSQAKSLEEKDIKFMLSSGSNYLFIARCKETNQIVGMATLIIYRIPFGLKGIMEDVVVDNKFRKQGIGSQLIESVLQKAREKGVSYLDFTSRPLRESANNLYKRLGFEKRDTNVYRYKIGN